ncbi:MAG TPA: dihydrodipicolinate reductase C-terminal domain-containing protein [Bryobacteraceae bacterium]|jgi:4-hydroxy-tetrahydrodipicolinate reductase
MKKLAIVGYGKMGHMIESLALSYGFTTAIKIDLNDPLAAAAEADVAIEFSTPEGAPKNLTRLAEMLVPTVCGTTGWLHEFDSIKAAYDTAETPLVWSPNFSIGVNIFFRLAEDAARLLSKYENYEAWAWEIHHSAKKDAPSGTLLQTVDRMIKAGYERPIHVASNRAGAIPGTHEIGFDSPADTITLRHSARSREGFARGALEAARWLVDGTGAKSGVHEFSQILFG